MILKKRFLLLVAAAGLLLAPGTRQPVGWPAVISAEAICSPALTRLFTPERPLLGRYEACADDRPITEVAPPDWTTETLEPGEAFEGAGSYDRAALIRLYGGRRARVARGWAESGDRFEATTLVSPYPDATLSALQPGTLVIRWICDRGGPECKMLNAAR